MAYKTKIEVRTGEKNYLPGTILPNTISPLDLEFLKSKKFVELVDDFPIKESSGNGDAEDAKSNCLECFKSIEEVEKIRSKKTILEYARTIGLEFDERHDGMSLEQMKESVINFQEEVENGSAYENL